MWFSVKTKQNDQRIPFFTVRNRCYVFHFTSSHPVALECSSPPGSRFAIKILRLKYFAQTGSCRTRRSTWVGFWSAEWEEKQKQVNEEQRPRNPHFDQGWKERQVNGLKIPSKSKCSSHTSQPPVRTCRKRHTNYRLMGWTGKLATSFIIFHSYVPLHNKPYVKFFPDCWQMDPKGQSLLACSLSTQQGLSKSFYKDMSL